MKSVIWCAELHLSGCSLTFGQAPCTATGQTGAECYNTFATCKDRTNLSTTTRIIKLRSNNSDYTGADSYGVPCLTDFPSFTSTKLKREGGVSQFGGVSLSAFDFPGDDDTDNDPYLITRQAAQGTFWGRFKARNVYYQKKPLIVKTGYIDDNNEPVWTSRREYRIDKITAHDITGKIQIVGRDYLSVIDRDSVLYPESTSTTVGAMDETQTTFQVLKGNISDFGVALIDDEVIRWSSVDRTGGHPYSVSGVTRGIYGTDKEAHESNTAFLETPEYINRNVLDIAYELLTKVAGIPQSYIPCDQYSDNPTGTPQEWDIEQDERLSGHIINHVITEPASVRASLDDLLKQCYVQIWFDADQSKIMVSSANTTLAGQTAIQINEQDNLLADSQRLKEIRQGIVTQSWTYHTRKTVTESDDIKNYRQLEVIVDTELESDKAWGEKRIRSLKANWLDGAGNIAAITNNRLLIENNAPRYELVFDLSEPLLAVGEFAVINTSLYQTKAGLNAEINSQIISMIETIPSARYTYTATIINIITPETQQRYFVISPDSMANYSEASDVDKEKYGWVNVGSVFPDGGKTYVIS